MSYLAFLDFGFSELILVGIVSLLVFGGNLPEVMRTLGQNYAKLRQTLREFAAPVRDEMNRVRDMPTPQGVVSQIMDDDDVGRSDDDEDDPATAGFDDESPLITSTPEPEDEPKRESTPDLLDEGPLV